MFPNLEKIFSKIGRFSDYNFSKLSQFNAFKNWQNCSFQNWYQIGILKFAKGGISAYLIKVHVMEAPDPQIWQGQVLR